MMHFFLRIIYTNLNIHHYTLYNINNKYIIQRVHFSKICLYFRITIVDFTNYYERVF